MAARIATGLIIIGSLLICIVLSQVQNEKGQRQGAERLIESIQGPALYNAYCGGCHGNHGKGGGSMAKSLKIPPADLTRIALHNRGKFPLARVQKIISGEEQIPTGHGGRVMPVWGPIFSEFEWDQDLGKVRVFNLARYIEQMQVK